ncbi:unannotated protein [freshwater metagenome]|uniref:Unannotated protein n=1 Tax=freshwater metagenome TaxID=449393 RepID=A0A6J6A5N3_9ZZZZ|nr:hypothetical protein [Actinomycetota bacterium]
MGRRSRKRGLSEAPAADSEKPSARTPQPKPDPAARRRARLDEAPKPPWAPVPLTEICIFVGIIVIGVALLGGSPRGLLIGFGLALIVIATLELCLREHLAGYRSHSVLISACSAVILVLPLALLTGLSKILLLGAAALFFGLLWWFLRNLFRNRSGGMSWRA